MCSERYADDIPLGFLNTQFPPMLLAGRVVASAPLYPTAAESRNSTRDGKLSLHNFTRYEQLRMAPPHAIEDPARSL